MTTKCIIIVLFAIILFFFSNDASALDVFVNAHADGFTTEDTWQINRSGTVLTSSENNITIDDSSGTNAGWVFSVGVSDFTQTGVSDPCVDSATLSVRVDVEDWLSMVLKDSTNTHIVGGDIAAASGSDIPAGQYTTNEAITGSGNINVIDVQPGFGTGVYNLTIDYTITLDDWLPNGTTITSSSSSGVFSNLSPVTVDNSNQKYQIFVGTYETTITYSVASNPQ